MGDWEKDLSLRGGLKLILEKMETLSIPIKEDVAERIKRYAALRDTTVSRITENFFLLITAPKANEKEIKISPLVQSFSIDGVTVPDDFDYKKALYDARNEKHAI